MSNDLAARLGILELYSRYTDAVWRKDWDAFGDCFAERSEWRIGGIVARGRGEIVGHIKRVLDNFNRVLVTTRPPILQITGGTAVGRAYQTEECVFKDGRVITPIGIYFDRYVREAERWRFTWRFFQTHYAGPPDLSGAFYENPDFGPPPAMPPLEAVPPNHTGMHREKP